MTTFKSSGAIPPREPGPRPLKRIATMAGAYGQRNYTVRDIRELKGKRTLVETLAFTPEGSVVMLPMMFVLGGLTFPLYSLLLSHTLDRSAPGSAMGASGASLRVNGVGAVVGPIIAGSIMAALGETSFFWCLVATHGTIALYVAYRLVAEDALPMSRQGPFVPLPARSTDFAIRLTSRPLRVSRSRLRRR